jgi:diaminohydroxyphosphoribosylaminopyrimidine deaminase/5-amino-6-(5-phosphoribosylamino)uracil reductase
MILETDRHWMHRALELARQGLWTTRPNPCVGCVIVKDQQLLGEGFHWRQGEPHAEVHALRQAGEQARGATCYVTLEPCAHFGRTPPCADALVAAGIQRVVVACTDRNPLVANQGLTKLRAAGIDVVEGVLRAKAQALNEGFLKRMQTGLPWVRIKMAASLDGKTALANGASKWITGAPARADVQAWRARSCAVVTGIGTLLADNPRLNVRYQDWAHQAVPEVREADFIQPLRVVLDTHARATPNLALFQSPTPIVLLSAKAYSHSFPEHVQCHVLPKHADKLCLVAALRFLGELQCNQILIEAGSTLAGALIDQGLWDELILYQAPKILGHQARSLFTLPDITSMQAVQSLVCTDRQTIGDDQRFLFRQSFTSHAEKEVTA